MLVLTLQLVNACIARIEAMTTQHRGAITEAHLREAVLADLLVATEAHHLQSQDVFIHLRALHLHAETVRAAGHPWPYPAASFQALRHHHLAAAQQNFRTRTSALTLRNHHVTSRLQHVQALDTLEHQLVVLLAIQAELHARAQGVRPTPLGDVDLRI